LEYPPNDFIFVAEIIASSVITGTTKFLLNIMTIDFQYTNFKADQKLLSYITKKLSKMDSVYDRIVHMVVYLKVENTDGPENKLVEVKANVANQTLFVSEASQSFESAADKVEEKLRSQIKKYKAKQA